MTPFNCPKQQRGATLVISLVMLVVLTLFALAGFNLSSVNLKIAGNFQQQRFIETTLQQSIERYISSSSAFSLSPASASYTVNGISVTISTPVCMYYATAQGESKTLGTLAPEDTQWEVRASGTDTVSGATTSIVQGVQVRLLEGNCAAMPT